MTVIPFPNSGRSIFDDTLAYTIAAAGEIIASHTADRRAKRYGLAA